MQHKGRAVFWVIVTIVMISFLIWQVNNGVAKINQANKQVEETQKEVDAANANLARANQAYSAFCTTSDQC